MTELETIKTVHDYLTTKEWDCIAKSIVATKADASIIKSLFGKMPITSVLKSGYDLKQDELGVLA